MLKEKCPCKSDFYQNFKEPLFLTGWLHRYHFSLVLRHLSVLSKNSSFTILVNIRQKTERPLKVCTNSSKIAPFHESCRTL